MSRSSHSSVCALTTNPCCQSQESERAAQGQACACPLSFPPPVLLPAVTNTIDSHPGIVGAVEKCWGWGRRGPPRACCEAASKGEAWGAGAQRTQRDILLWSRGSSKTCPRPLSQHIAIRALKAPYRSSQWSPSAHRLAFLSQRAVQFLTQWPLPAPLCWS